MTAERTLISQIDDTSVRPWRRAGFRSTGFGTYGMRVGLDPRLEKNADEFVETCRLGRRHQPRLHDGSHRVAPSQGVRYPEARGKSLDRRW